MNDLVKRAKDGDKDALSELILLYQNDVKKYAISMVKNLDDADDIVQATLLKVCTSIHTIREDEKFKSWIMTIANNVIIDFFKSNKKQEAIVHECKKVYNPYDYMEDPSDAYKILDVCNDKEKSAIKLSSEGLSRKQIAGYLNLKEETVKTILRRGKIKVKRVYKPATLIAFFFALLVTGVIAVSIIKHVMGLFETDSVGQNNDGVLMAIENLNWYQETNMDYIDIGEGNKIKLEYLVMDEMSLYMVFDFYSEENISKYTDISIDDLILRNENGMVICDHKHSFATKNSIRINSKLIERNNHNMKFLFYMYTDSFPISHTLDISFSKIVLSKKLDTKELTGLDANFKIDLIDKFVNRKFTTYSSNTPNIEKSIISSTGFYSIISIDGSNVFVNSAKLIAENGNSYDCYVASLNFYDDNNQSTDLFKYMITANINDLENNKLKLIIENTEYELTKD